MMVLAAVLAATIAAEMAAEMTAVMVAATMAAAMMTAAMAAATAAAAVTVAAVAEPTAWLQKVLHPARSRTLFEGGGSVAGGDRRRQWELCNVAVKFASKNTSYLNN